MLRFDLNPRTPGKRRPQSRQGISVVQRELATPPVNTAKLLRCRKSCLSGCPLSLFIAGEKVCNT